MNVLRSVFAEPWPWWAAGGAIGLFVTAFAWLTGKPLGVSSGFGTVCASCAPRLSYFQKKPYSEKWRLWFLLGIPLGGLAGAALAGRLGIVTAMGAFDTAVTPLMPVKLAILFAGGAIAGFGARWADG